MLIQAFGVEDLSLPNRINYCRLLLTKISLHISSLDIDSSISNFIENLSQMPTNSIRSDSLLTEGYRLSSYIECLKESVTEYSFALLYLVIDIAEYLIWRSLIIEFRLQTILEIPNDMIQSPPRHKLEMIISSAFTLGLISDTEYDAFLAECIRNDETVWKNTLRNI
jgi:hypothetical protein